MALMQTQTARECDYCGEAIRGRSDKRFCSAECRNGFHNHMSSINDAMMRRVNKILRRNRRILAEMCPAGKVTKSRTSLEDRGFNFSYFTHQRPSRDGQSYNFCYEYGYLPLRENLYLIVHRTEGKRTNDPPSADPKTVD